LPRTRVGGLRDLLQRSLPQKNLSIFGNAALFFTMTSMLRCASRWRAGQ